MGNSINKISTIQERIDVINEALIALANIGAEQKELDNLSYVREEADIFITKAKAAYKALTGGEMVLTPLDQGVHIELKLPVAMGVPTHPYKPQDNE